jgi:hypothetical protein
MNPHLRKCVAILPEQACGDNRLTVTWCLISSGGSCWSYEEFSLPPYQFAIECGMLMDRNPRHWKLLILYFNPAEPSLLVRKRTGFPFTMNFARPAARAITAIILATVVILAVHNNRN